MSNILFNPTNKRIAFLDYLRIIAFVSVLIGHQYYNELAIIANDITYHASIRTIISDVILPISVAGGAGVIIFFLISGYIITEVLRKETTGQFLIRRIFRIYPLYIFAVLIELAILKFNGTPMISMADILPRLLLIGDFFHTPYALTGVEWTLRAEILFYVFMALTKATSLYENKKLFFLAMIILSFGMLLCYPFPNGLAIGYTFLFMHFLFAGVVINLFKNREISGFSTLLFCIFILCIFFYLYPIHHSNYSQSNFPLIAMGVFLLFFYLNDKLELNKFISFIAKLTFPIYLFHNFLILFIERRLDVLSLSSRVTAFICFFIFVVTIHFLIEKPFIKLGARLANKLTARKKIFELNEEAAIKNGTV